MIPHDAPQLYTQCLECDVPPKPPLVYPDMLAHHFPRWVHKAQSVRQVVAENACRVKCKEIHFKFLQRQRVKQRHQTLLSPACVQTVDDKQYLFLFPQIRNL